MLGPTLASLRLFLHVLAAAVWVGGQLVLGGLVPALRSAAPEAPRAAARAFARIAWPAYGVLVLTGIWNVVEVEVGDRPSSYHVTLFVKLVVVALSGIAAFVHGQARSKAALAAGGALAAVTSLAALYLGILLVAGGA